jgi:hypothetical protein
LTTTNGPTGIALCAVKGCTYEAAHSAVLTGEDAAAGLVVRIPICEHHAVETQAPGGSWDLDFDPARIVIERDRG